jgi:hypothetical protein
MAKTRSSSLSFCLSTRRITAVAVKCLLYAGDSNRRCGFDRPLRFHIGMAEAAGVDEATVIGHGQGGRAACTRA